MDTLNRELMRTTSAALPRRLGVGGGQSKGPSDPLLPEGLRLAEAIRIQSAEFWLGLGLPDRASRELEQLPTEAAKHPWSLRLHLVVYSALSLR